MSFCTIARSSSFVLVVSVQKRIKSFGRISYFTVEKSLSAIFCLNLFIRSSGWTYVHWVIAQLFYLIAPLRVHEQIYEDPAVHICRSLESQQRERAWPERREPQDLVILKSSKGYRKYCSYEVSVVNRKYFSSYEKHYIRCDHLTNIAQITFSIKQINNIDVFSRH